MDVAGTNAWAGSDYRSGGVAIISYMAKHMYLPACALCHLPTSQRSIMPAKAARRRRFSRAPPARRKDVARRAGCMAVALFLSVAHRRAKLKNSARTETRIASFALCGLPVANYQVESRSTYVILSALSRRRVYYVTAACAARRIARLLPWRYPHLLLQSSSLFRNRGKGVCSPAARNRGRVRSRMWHRAWRRNGGELKTSSSKMI